MICFSLPEWIENAEVTEEDLGAWFESLPIVQEQFKLFDKTKLLCGNGYPGIPTKQPPKSILAKEKPC